MTSNLVTTMNHDQPLRRRRVFGNTTDGTPHVPENTEKLLHGFYYYSMLSLSYVGAVIFSIHHGSNN